MFNSPRVTFLKGNALGDTAQEVIDKKEFKSGQQTTLFEEAPAKKAPVAKKKKFKRGTKIRDIVDKLGCPKKK